MIDQPQTEPLMTPSPQKVALVTGAARGIGLAVAKRFLAEGWRVALLAIEGELLWNRVLTVNLTGPFLCTKAAAPLMREHGGGAIVNITSISAVRASTLRSAYGTSKAGLAHLTKQLAVELASLGIRVNAVAPGPVETAMAKAVHTAEIRADYHDAIPLDRYGLEEELAEAIFFLCSDRSSYITGQILAVDGGFDAAGIGLPTLRGDRRNG